MVVHVLLHLTYIEISRTVSFLDKGRLFLSYCGIEKYNDTNVLYVFNYHRCQFALFTDIKVMEAIIRLYHMFNDNI